MATVEADTPRGTIMHPRRLWQKPAEYPDLEVLAKAITGTTWTLCSAFRWQDLVFCNDATHEDGAGEYAVFYEHPDEGWLQIESYTCSWMKPESFVKCANHEQARVEAGIDLSDTYLVQHRVPNFNHPQGTCPLCA